MASIALGRASWNVYMRLMVDDIIKDLDQTRRRVGAEKAPFVPRGFDRLDEMDLESVEEVESLFHESGLLVHNGLPVFVYIRDHTLGGHLHIGDRRRIHFAVCSTLKSMRQQGRFARYRRTNRDNDLYLIDTPNIPVEEEVPLWPCQNCLKLLNYQCFNSVYNDVIKRSIMENFKAKTAFNLLRQHFEIFRTQVSGMKGAGLPTGYSKKWGQIARIIKKNKNYQCEECGGDFRWNHSGLDVHHIDHDKSNDVDNNLRCLCKSCHSKLHPHYRIPGERRRTWRNQ